MKHAFDVQGLHIVRCRDVDTLEEHQPKSPPFFSKRGLWYARDENYVVWLQRAAHGERPIRFFMRIDPSTSNLQRVGGEISNFTISPLYSMLWKQFKKTQKDKKKQKQQNDDEEAVAEMHAAPTLPAADDDVAMAEPLEIASTADNSVAMSEPAESAVQSDRHEQDLGGDGEARTHNPREIVAPPSRDDVKEDVVSTSTWEEMHARIFGEEEEDATGAAASDNRKDVADNLFGSDGEAADDATDETATELQKKLEELRNKLKQEEERRAEEATRAENEKAERLKIEKRHKEYITRTCKERKELRKDKVEAEEKQQEALRKMHDAEAAVKAAWEQKTSPSSNTAGSAQPTVATGMAICGKVYIDLIKLVHTQLTAAIASIILRRKPKYVTVRKPKQPAKRAKHSSSSSSSQRMAFWIDLAAPGNSVPSWTLLTTKAVCDKLNDLVAGKMTVAKYTASEHPYETTLVRQHDARTATSGELMQKNVGGKYSTQRTIKFEPSKNGGEDEDDDEEEEDEEEEEVLQEEPKDARHLLTVNERDEIQFGTTPFIKFDQHVLEKMHAQVRDVLTVCDVKTDTAVCVDLSNLADDYVALGVSISGKDSYTYNPSKTEIWIKPQVLYGWLSWAKERRMFRAAVCLHGATEEGYKGMRDFTYGFDMKHAGAHGRTYGDGWYLGRSIHVTTGYNNTSVDAPLGTAIMALALTTDDIAKHSSGSYHGGYKAANSSQAGHDAHSFGLSNPTLDKTNCPERKTRDNCLVLHDARLALPLGLIVANKKK